MTRDECFELFREFRRTGARLSRERDADLKVLGLTSGQSDTLLFLESNPGCQISDLAAFLMTSHQAARTLVERMDAKGLLVVASSDSDGRAKSISLSGSGRDMCAEIRRMGGDTASHALSALSPEDRAVLRELLGRISSNLP